MTPLTEEWWAELLRLARVVKDEAELDGRMNRGTKNPAALSAWRGLLKHIETRRERDLSVPPGVRYAMGLCTDLDWPGDAIFAEVTTVKCENCSSEFFGHAQRRLCKKCTQLSFDTNAYVPARVPRPRLTRLDGGLDDFDEYQGPEELQP